MNCLKALTFSKKFTEALTILLFKGFGPVIGILLKSLTPVIKALTPAIEPLARAMVPLVELFGAGLLIAVQLITPAIILFAQWAGKSNDVHSGYGTGRVSVHR